MSIQARNGHGSRGWEEKLIRRGCGIVILEVEDWSSQA